MQHVSAILCGAVLVLAAQDQQPVRLERSKLVDLTHAFDENAVYWPTAAPFRWEKEHWGPSPGGYWYAAGRYAASEHGGTPTAPSTSAKARPEWTRSR